MLKQLFSGQTTDADSAAVNWPGGPGVLIGTGGFGTGTLSLEMLVEGTTWAPVTGVSMTAAGVAAFNLPQASIRADLTGATAATLSAQVRG